MWFGFVCVLRTVKPTFVQINFQVSVGLEILLKIHHCHPVEVQQGIELSLKLIFEAGHLVEGFLVFLPLHTCSVAQSYPTLCDPHEL